MDLFVEKYRPKMLDQLIINEQSRLMIKRWLDKGTINNLLLSGNPGIGKTSLARIIENELKCDVLYINCSVDSGIDMIRSKVNEFCQMEAIDGNIKIVILDEFDSCRGTGENSAQAALRNPIEDASDDTRFILTCNYVHRIIKPIRSRCLELELSFEIHDVVKRVVEILRAENVTFEKTVLMQFAEDVIKPSYPDIRNVIKTLEAWCAEGKLVPIKLDNTQDWDKVLKYITDNIKDIKTLSEYLIKNQGTFSSDFERLLNKLFYSYVETGDSVAMVMIGEGLKGMLLGVDPQTQMLATLAHLNQHELGLPV